MKEAFDLIKERLEEESHYSCFHCIERAISIVSEVEAELGNDVCEWKNEKGMFIQNPHTGRKFSNEPSMKNVYCNTCGKKIKVVGNYRKPTTD